MIQARKNRQEGTPFALSAPHFVLAAGCEDRLSPGGSSDPEAQDFDAQTLQVC